MGRPPVLKSCCWRRVSDPIAILLAGSREGLSEWESQATGRQSARLYEAEEQEADTRLCPRIAAAVVTTIPGTRRALLAQW